MHTNHQFFKSLFSLIFLFTILISCENSHDTSQQEVQDIDGNSYAVIAIGKQLWMAENLKATRFNDGSKIPRVKDNHDWNKLKTPGYCWYNNNENNKSEYGALYNWFVVDTCEICPIGWHVPTDEEWAELEVYLENNGYNYDGSMDVDYDRRTNNKIGKAICSTTGWKFSKNEGAIGNSDYPEYQNRIGFNMLAGGYRDANGTFCCLNSLGNCWSATESDSSHAWYRRFLYSSVKVLKDDHWKRDAFSVRCVRLKDLD